MQKRTSRKFPDLFEKGHSVVRLNVKRTTRKPPSFRSSKKITPSSFSRVSTALICVIGQEQAAVVLNRAAVHADVGNKKEFNVSYTNNHRLYHIESGQNKN